MASHEVKSARRYLNFRHRASCILGQAIHYSPENAFYIFNPYSTVFPDGNGMVLHFYQQQESSTTKTVHKVINKGLKAYV